MKYLASGGAAYDWVVVRRCPLCGFAHRHLLLEVNASVIERAPACAKHRTYLVMVADVIPTAADRRQLGAA